MCGLVTKGYLAATISLFTNFSISNMAVCENCNLAYLHMEWNTVWSHLPQCWSRYRAWYLWGQGLPNEREPDLELSTPALSLNGNQTQGHSSYRPTP